MAMKDPFNKSSAVQHQRLDRLSRILAHVLGINIGPAHPAFAPAGEAGELLIVAVLGYLKTCAPFADGTTRNRQALAVVNLCDQLAADDQSELRAIVGRVLGTPHEPMESLDSLLARNLSLTD